MRICGADLTFSPALFFSAVVAVRPPTQLSPRTPHVLYTCKSRGTKGERGGQ
jgi:hypothetical protein